MKKTPYEKPDKLAPAPLPSPKDIPYTGDLDEAELLKDQKKIELKIQKMFPAEFVKVLKGLAYYLSTVGLEFDEACLMVRFEPEDMLSKIKEFPIIQQLIDIKKLEYKVSLLKTISKRGINGDEKLALWLLERRFPGEFNPKKGAGSQGDSDGTDAMDEAIKFIQKQANTDPLIKDASGKSFVMKKNSHENIMDSVNKILK